MLSRLLGNAAVRKSVMLGVAAAGLVSRRVARSRPPVRSVMHLSPTYFDERSVLGGAERYAHGLARAMASLVPTELVSFGAQRMSFRRGPLSVEIYPATSFARGVRFDPVAFDFLKRIRGADVIHCHQYETFVTTLAIACGAWHSRTIAVTDLGGRASSVTRQLPVERLVDVFMPISRFAATFVPAGRPCEVIYGGVEEEFFAPPAERRREGVVFVGRLLPHKGIDYLIEAMDPGIPLTILGRPYDADYYAMLRELARGRNVVFRTDAGDAEILEACRSAAVAVLPSVLVDVNGRSHPQPELFGLAAAEAMAAGAPVIVTDVASLPELVEDGKSGFVVPPNDSDALRERIRLLVRDPELARSMGANAAARAETRFRWSAVAAGALRGYRAAAGSPEL